MNASQDLSKSEERLDSAWKRTMLAAERTLLAYWRTGLAFGGAGLLLIKFFASSAAFFVGGIFLVSGLALFFYGTQKYLFIWRRRRKIPRR